MKNATQKLPNDNHDNIAAAQQPQFYGGLLEGVGPTMSELSFSSFASEFVQKIVRLTQIKQMRNLIGQTEVRKAVSA